MIFEELKEIQRKHGWLPADELETLSRRTDTPLHRIHTVASFYPHFHLAPPAAADVRVCADMSCHLRGAAALKAALAAQFRSGASGVSAAAAAAPVGAVGAPAPSGGGGGARTGTAAAQAADVSFRDVSCLGRCDRAPALSINDRIYSGVTLDEAAAMVRGVLKGEALPPAMEEKKPVQLQSDPYPADGRYAVLRWLVENKKWDAAMASIKAAELKGMGGAFFPTATKWEAVKNAPGREKYVVCNADESEPGTIKDRFIMTRIPHMLVEGMAICGLITGARKGTIYIRHEYEAQEHILEAEIERCRAAGLLGERILGGDLGFELDVFVSPGGYICGEETALLEAMEGKRSEPRNKPPFPVLFGLWGKPTVINNVETFSNVPLLLARGVEWYKSKGQGGAFGLKFVGVSGQVRNPGVFEVAMGTKASEVVMGLAGGPLPGHTIKAWAPSGPSSGYLPASLLETRLDVKSLAAAGSTLGSGAIVVCDERACMLDMALNCVAFFRNESCGKCVPCRVGSQKMVDILTRWSKQQARPGDMELLDELAEAMKMTSICGLGQIAPVPITSVIKHFREEIDAHVLQGRCPAGVCF